MDGPERLGWSRSAPYGLAAWSLPPGGAILPHRHDFVEVFWVVGGAPQHRCAGGERLLSPGDCAFLRADDVHGLEPQGGQACAWVNLALRRDEAERLRRTYAADLAWWPWDEESIAPRHARLRPAGLAEMQRLAVGMPLRDGRRLDLDALLLALLRLLQPRAVEAERAAPAWFDEALERFREPARLRQGLGALRRLCGCGGEHLNRTVRRCCGCSATRLVRRLRLEQAARDLRLGHDAILDIALAAGFDNLSYFYRAFRAEFGMTPRAWRLAARR